MQTEEAAQARDLRAWIRDQVLVGQRAPAIPGQGREVGLDRMISDGFTIIRSIQSGAWPAASVNLEFAAVWGSRGRIADQVLRVSDGVPVARISSLLEPAGGVEGAPVRLAENARKSFIGCYVLGMGFVLVPDEAQDWIVVRGKSPGGFQAGFRAEHPDDPGQVYQLEVDPVDHPQLATAAELIGTLIYHALGYFVEDVYLVRVDPARITIADTATIRDASGERRFNPRWYDLMLELEKLTGNGVSLNTSLNRRGEPMICSPTDALNMFYGSDLQYLIMEDILVVKDGKDWYDSI